jgi:hypothetical protein
MNNHGAESREILLITSGTTVRSLTIKPTIIILLFTGKSYFCVKIHYYARNFRKREAHACITHP